MRTKNRLLAVILLVVFAMISCIACSKDEGNTDSKNPTVTETPESKVTEAVTETPAVTEEPKATITETPEAIPSDEPSVAPTEEPTEAPTEAPTQAPEVVENTPADVYKYAEYYSLLAENIENPPVVNISIDEKKNTVRVSSVEELIEAIAPNTNIIVEPGEYNISDFISTIGSDKDIINWNYKYEHVNLEEVYDGYEIHIVGANGLRIFGAGETRDDTHIVTTPRYAALFVFDNCRDIVLSNFKTGHTKQSDCSGNVIDFYGTSDVIVDNMDIYGCGVLGIGMYGNSGNILVNNSYIHDCSNGTFDASVLWGTLICVDCTFDYSSSFGYDPMDDQDYEAVMYRCFFGPNEAEVIYRKYFEDYDCEWSEPAYYPESDGDGDWGWDYDYSPEDFINAPKKVIPIDSQVFNNTFWYGYAVHYTEIEESYYLPYWVEESEVIIYNNIEFNEDGTGYYDDGFDTSFNFNWEVSSNYTVSIKGDGVEYECTAYIFDDEEDDHDIYLCMNKDTAVYWYAFPVSIDEIFG